MGDTTKLSRRSLREMFQNMFRLSTFCGLFPFLFTENDLVLSYLFLPISIIYIIISGFFTTYFLVINFYHKSIQISTYTLTINYASPIVVSNFIPIVSIFWIWINSQKFSKMFRALKIVESFCETGFSLPFYKSHFLLFVIFPLFVVDYKFSDYVSVYSIFIYLKILNIYLVTAQFTSILTTIRNYYSFLEKTLCISTAVEWVQCHEVLGACCEIANRCYAPQLLIISLSTFGFTTTSIYILIAHDYYYTNDNRILAVIWVFVVMLQELIFVRQCHETVQKAKRFDKKLYRLVLNDITKQLLRNKRIRHHFKAKRKVEFSAMGFFNFDYSLVGTMVSTATTYILIMVQFTP